MIRRLPEAERRPTSQPRGCVYELFLLWRDDRGCDHVRCRLQRISHFVLPNAILRHCGVDIGQRDFFGAPHRGSRLEPRGSDPAIVFGRYCRRHNRPSLSAKRPIQQSGSSMILRRCESPGDTARMEGFERRGGVKSWPAALPAARMVAKTEGTMPSIILTPSCNSTRARC
jgi:hypothetical protein